jgi:hypothetical protein
MAIEKVNTPSSSAALVEPSNGKVTSAWLGFFSGVEKATRSLLNKSAATSAIVPVASANATDLATAITLANELKTKLNAVIAASQ